MMKTIKVKFKVRYVGDMFPTEKTDLVDVESDSTPDEVVLQVREHYNDYYVKYNDKVCETYEPEIL